MTNADIELFMKEALAEAEKARCKNEVPVGAVIIGPEQQIIARSHNLIESTGFVGAHAELVAIKDASEKAKNWRLDNCKVFVTMEPCLMCSAAMVLSRVSEVYFGCFDQRFGGATSAMEICSNSKLPHQIKVVGGILEKECREILSNFFTELRNKKKLSKS